MEQPTRMFRTLGSLAVAMTASALWLGWIDPSVPLSAEPPSFDAVLDHARSLVVSDVRIHKDLWRNVEVVSDTTGLPDRALLAARRDPGRCHFRIDLEGRLTKTQRWESQDSLAGDSVVIAMEQVDWHSEMSRAQFDGLRGLLVVLRDATSTGGHAALGDQEHDLPVRVHDGWAQVYGLEPGTIVEIPTGAATVG